MIRRKFEKYEKRVGGEVISAFQRPRLKKNREVFKRSTKQSFDRSLENLFG